MTSRDFEVFTLPTLVSEGDYRQLGALLVDALDAGAAVSFLVPLSQERAEEWWRRTIPNNPRAVTFVARVEGNIRGVVQLQPAWAPNQPHRAEVCKLIVHRSARNQGLATALMEAAERYALQSGWTLLTLDARSDAPAVGLYRKLGWVEVGVIPRYAVNPGRDGYHDTVIFYKELAAPAALGDGRG